jgi:hypothetical protein
LLENVSCCIQQTLFLSQPQLIDGSNSNNLYIG